MQKILLFIIGIMFAGYAFGTDYCPATAKYSDWEYIAEVRLGNIHNKSGSEKYQDFTGLGDVIVYKNEGLPFEIITKKYSSADRLEVYIDYNQNGTFEVDELVPVTFTGVNSLDGTVNTKLIIPDEKPLVKTRMRIVLYDSSSDYSGLTGGCGEFEYGEVEDYTIDIRKIETAPETDFLANVTSIFSGGIVRFTDNTTLAPTAWQWQITPNTYEFIEGTDATTRNPVVKFNESGKYSIQLTSSNAYGSKVLKKDDYIVVRGYSAPKQLEGKAEGTHVELSWLKPNVPGMIAYNNDLHSCFSVVYAKPRRGVLFTPEKLNFSFPVSIDKLTAGFYYSSNNPWPDTKYKFKIFNANTNALIYESDYLEAVHAQENVHELSSVLVINEPFIVAVEPKDESGMPSNLAKSVDAEMCNTYVFDESDSKWKLLAENGKGYELFVRVGVTHDVEATAPATGDKFSSKYVSDDSVEIEGVMRNVNVKGVVSAENATLKGYKVFRNDTEVAVINDPSKDSYVDRGLANGDYNYYVKAVFSNDAASPKSNAVDVTVDNTNPEIQVTIGTTDFLTGSNYSFPSNVDINGTRDIDVTITNEGVNTLDLSSVKLVGEGEFTIQNTPATSLNGGETTTVTVRFAPTKEGPQTTVLTIANNDNNENPFTLNIKAVGGLDRWTWMVYLYEDGTGLDGIKDFNEWEINGSIQGEINYLVCFDANDDAKDGYWLVKKDKDGMNRTLVSEKLVSFSKDPHMSDPTVLDNFMTWAKDNYPAQHYGLTLWDHGDGIFKRSKEEKSITKGFVGSMKLWELETVCKKFTAAVGKPIDIIGFDVCLLGQIETAYQMKDVAKYVIASELTEPGDGWDYDRGFRRLNEDSSLPAVELAKDICNTFTDAYKPGGASYPTGSTQAVISIDELTNSLMPKLNEFSEELVVAVRKYFSSIEYNRTKSWHAVDSGGEKNPDHKDLGHFLKNLIADTELPQALKDKAAEVLVEYEKAVVVNGYTGTENKNSTGMKIWMPKKYTKAGTAHTYYSKPDKYVKFGETKWVEFLKEYENPTPVEAPVADFTISKTKVNVGEIITLKDMSSNVPTSFEWTITPEKGYEFVTTNGKTQSQTDVKFSSTGVYTIKLKVSNNIGEAELIKEDVINVVHPQAISPANLTGKQEKADIILNWMAEATFSSDDFESYPVFSLAFGPWKQVDRDGAKTFGSQNNTWENQGYVGSFMVFDFSKTTPPMIENWQAPSGKNILTCWGADGKANDDWLISPKVTVKDGDFLNFAAASVTEKYGLERIKVGISTTGNDPDDFTIISDGEYIELPIKWTQYSFDLADYVGKDIYFTINVVSNNAWVALFDDINVGAKPEAQTKDMIKVSVDGKRSRIKFPYAEEAPKATLMGYKVYRNNEEIATTAADALTYTDKTAEVGELNYSVRSVYEIKGEEVLSGLSNILSITKTKYTEPDGPSNDIKTLEELGLILYPNPSNGEFTINSENVINGTVRVFSIEGQLILQKEFNSNRVTVRGLNSGMYIVKVDSDDDSASVKLIVK
jgi:PKD repeat protein